MATESSAASSSADSYIGSLISLTSKYEIRYEGVLYNINAEESSIGLTNVRSFGTEGRKKDGPQVPPGDKVYEYILFRGSDIKDLQVKSSPSVQPTPSINNDPAIIQSHYPRPVATSTSLPSAGSGSLPDLGPHTSQRGLTASNFQGGLPLYQPGGNLGSWGASPTPPAANGGGLATPMSWPGFYYPNGLPHLHQQALLQPPLGLSMQQPMQYPNYSTPLPSGAPNPLSSGAPNTLPSGAPNLLPSGAPNPLPSGAPNPLPSGAPNPLPSGAPNPLPSGAPNLAGVSNFNFPGSNMPAFSLLPVSTSPINLMPTSLSPSTMPSSLPPVHSASLASETLSSSLPQKAHSSTVPTATFGASLPSLAHLTTSGPELNPIILPSSNKPNAISATLLPYQSSSQSMSPIVGSSNSVHSALPAPSLVTPGQLLQSLPATTPSLQAESSSQSAQTAHRDVEVVKVSSSLEPSAPVASESLPPILPLPVPSRGGHKPHGSPFQARYGYRGRERGRGTGNSRPVTKFSEDFDFMAMNEKFKKDEVWGHLGKSNKTHSKDKEGSGQISDGEDSQDEGDAGVPKVEIEPVYNKDDFFDSLSSNARDYESQNGRMRFSEQRKLDTETFGEFPRYRGGRGGRGGRSRGSYNGRGYGYSGRGRGRGRGMPNRAS